MTISANAILILNFSRSNFEEERRFYVNFEGERIPLKKFFSCLSTSLSLPRRVEADVPFDEWF